jgi:hypothetical protein
MKTVFSIDDIDWFAIDRNGEVAHFTTGVFGILPMFDDVLESQLDQIADFFFEKEKNGEAIISPGALEDVTLPHHDHNAQSMYLKDYQEMAEKGLYSYAWRDSCNLYKLICYPTSPLNLRHIPSSILKTLGMFTFSDFQFRQIKELTL